jgi:hypothetical protein
LALSSRERAHALEIGDFVGRQTAALRFPQRLGEAFDHLMLGVVFATQSMCKIDEGLSNPEWPIGADLIANGEVQTHVQEGIRLSTLGSVVAIEHAIRILECGLILWMQLYHVRYLSLERLERQTFAALAPGLDVHLSKLIAGLIVEEGHGIENRVGRKKAQKEFFK